MTPTQALAWLNSNWKSSKFAKTIPAAGGLGIDVDGLDGFQCKDFANAYGIALGHPLPLGNAIVLAQKLNDGWNWVPSPQPGDLAVRNYVSGGVNYGDVVAVLSVSGSNLNTIGQNQVHSSLTIGHVPTTGVNPIKGFIKFVRPVYTGGSMNPSATDVQNYIKTYTKADATPAQVSFYTARPWQTLATDVCDSLLSELNTAQSGKVNVQINGVLYVPEA